MIFQQIYQILELYCNHVDSLKIAVDEYCKEIILRYLQNNIKNENQVNQLLKKFLRNELLKLGFKKENIDFIVLRELNNIKKNETHTYSDFQKFLINKIDPLILELILLTYFEYLVNNNLSNLLLNLKSINLFDQ